MNGGPTNFIGRNRDYLWDNVLNNRIECPCDYDFCDIVKSRPEFNFKKIYHMGSGGHHFVGRTMRDLGINTVSITFSETEHNKYLELLTEDPSIGENYICYLGNIYSTPFEVFGTFDCITLFHLCESGGTVEEGKIALDRCLKSLGPEGLVVFYVNSNAWENANLVKEAFVKALKITPYGQPESGLWFFKKNET